MLLLKKENLEMPDDPRIAEFGITESAIQARMLDVRKAVSASDEETRKMASCYLCTIAEELSRYGAKITWN